MSLNCELFDLAKFMEIWLICFDQFWLQSECFINLICFDVFKALHFTLDHTSITFNNLDNFINDCTNLQDIS